MSLIRKNVNVYTERIGFVTYSELEHIFPAYGSVKNYIYSRFSSIGSYEKVHNYKKEIRDKLTSEGFLEGFSIPKRYVRMAMDEAVSNIKTNWVQATKSVKSLISKNGQLSDDEKHYLYYSLKAKQVFVSILNKEKCDIPEKFSGLNIRRLNSLFRRYVRKSLPKKSVSKVCSSVMIDAQMWREKDGIFYISGLNKGKTYSLKLNTKPKLNGNLRIVLERAKRNLRISNAIEVCSKPMNNDGLSIGVDKNYINALDTSNGSSYGVCLNAEQGIYTDILSAKNKKRNYYTKLVDKYSKAGNHEKANRIQKFNLGKKKYNKQKNKFFEEIRKKVNYGIKQMIIVENPQAIVCENLNFSVSNKQKKVKYSRKANGKLSGFVKGYIQERMEYIANMNEINIKKVNAAYSSQTCSQCGNFGLRKGDMFYCASCGKVEYSGHVAAKVILSRENDDEIKLTSPPFYVKNLLIKRLADKKLLDEVAQTSLEQSMNRVNLDLGQEEIFGEERIIRNSIQKASFR